MNSDGKVELLVELQSIIQLNPFDAVVILKKQQGSYYVIVSNTSATLLFDANYEGVMLATHYFNVADWDVIQPCVDQVNERSSYVTLHNENQIVVNVQRLQSVGMNYYCLVMRLLPSVAAHGFNTQLENAKHLSFVEQYVDPIIFLNLNGEIVYINVAAKKGLQEGHQLIGQNILAHIGRAYKNQFSTLLSSAFEGYSSGQARIELRNILFNEESVNIHAIPTYWDGKVIGVHLVVKKVAEVIQSASNYFPAYEDELTGLLNRQALNDRWEHYLNSYPDLNTALVLVNIDRFKRFNESLGKRKADGMLTEISKRFKQIRNEFCEVFRYHGDEYVLIVNYDHIEEVEAVANKVIQVLLDPLIVDEQDYFVTASMGISTSKTGQLAELEKMLHQADQALFTVKNNGFAHYQFFQIEMSHLLSNEALMEAHLKRAIEFEELSVFFQPQLNLETNAIDSFEALMRWDNRKFGSVSPAQFIPLAEASGLIIQIGDWIIERICQYQQEWRSLGYRPVRVAINISPKQFKREGFVRRLEQLFMQYEVDTSYIELEITESSMMNASETMSILNDLKKLGVFVSVDDFGTGYSSLSYLTTYPIDIIKIDRSFISEINNGKKNDALVEAIIHLSQKLGLEVIAEGVEDRGQENFLKKHHCKKVQGYLYDRPLPVNTMVAQYLM